MTFLERWANPQPARPPVLPEAADREPVEAGSHSVDPATNLPEMPEPTQEELANAVVNGVDSPTTSFKGQAVELWRDGRRFFIVADEDDAQEAIRRFGTLRGEVWTSGELELVASIPDQDMRDEVESLKREMGGCLSPDAAGRCISAAEWQAEMLNQIFKEQGLTGQPAKITAAMVRRGERRTRL